MSEKMFLIIFVLRKIFAFLIVVLGTWMLVKKRGAKISVDQMVECRLKDIMKRKSKIINIVLDILLCVLFFIIIVGSIIPAIKDTPYIIHKNLITFRGEVITGSSLESKIKLKRIILRF